MLLNEISRRSTAPTNLPLLARVLLIAASVDRSWIFACSDCPEPLASLRCLRLLKYTANNLAVIQHNVIIFGVVERTAVLAARRFEN
jgi:hypothetical protein